MSCVLCPDVNCDRGSKCCGIISTWSISVPTKKQLSLKILYYTVKLDGLPFYKLKERYKLKAEISKTILIARIYGYFKIGKIK